VARKKILYNGLGFPMILVGFRTKKVQGEEVPDVNFKELQAKAFLALTHKPGPLIGAELAFVRAYLAMTQVEFARKVGLANHSRVSQWEKKGLKPTGMEFMSELSVRLLMASALQEGMIAKVYRELSEKRLSADTEPVVVPSSNAA